MPVIDSPLRYPGGKSQLIPLVLDIMRENSFFYGEYAEPFAGGSGVALHLLFNGYVDRIYLNDIDQAIYAFWYSVINKNDEFCDLIERVDVDIAQWRYQRCIYLDKYESDYLKKGFSVFFLNRTNRSGIIKAGVIGGINQNGKYKIDCRFDKKNLIARVKRIAKYKDQISLTNLDAVDFIKEIVPCAAEKTLVNIDPPYFKKGKDLYTNFYTKKDHEELAKVIQLIEKNWMVTYDDSPEIRALFGSYKIYSNNLNYSAQTKRVGTELLILDPRLNVPESLKKLNFCI